jgi:hypothetical protein
VLVLELQVQHVLLLPHYLLLLLLEFFQTHHQSLESLLVRLLQHEILDGWIGLFIIHEFNYIM